MNRDMNRQEVEALTRIGRSLWGDLSRAIEMSEETLGTVSLLNLSQERAIERTVRVLIERAENAPPSALRLNHPFFRLAPLERFLLTAIAVEKWSYEKVARILEVDVTTIEPWIWSIRLRFSFELLALELDYPHGPSTMGPSCPDYQPSSPWTQRMLDDALGKREQMFLQNHLMACDRCRHTLDLTRKMFFKIEAQIPVRSYDATSSEAIDRILATWQEGSRIARPIQWTFTESLLRFVARPKSQLMLASLCLVIAMFFRHKG